MSHRPHRRLDATGVRCPEVMDLARDAVEAMQVGQLLEVVADDPVVFLDLPDWCASAGHEVLSMEQRRDVITTLMRVG